MHTTIFTAAVTAVAFSLLAGCASGPAPTNRPAAAWMPQQALPTALSQCVTTSPPGFSAERRVSPGALGVSVAPIAPGDRLRIHVAGDDATITGVYVVAEDGTLRLPGIAPLIVAGFDEGQVRRAVAAALVAGQLIRPVAGAVDLRLIENAGVSVAVTGAVFDPGTTRVGERNVETRVGQREGAASGDANTGRSLSAALRAAGGVRPDADVAHIYLARGDRWTVLDFTGVVAGRAITDVMLAADDRITVASASCFHADLVRPSAITAPGIRVYMSNLSRPAASNASSAIGKDSTSLPYGTRMLQGLVSMNCIGGSAMNAGRRAVLISRNPMTGESVVVERQVESLVRGSGRDAVDPYLMPGDALACYDSRAMNFADVVGLVSSAVSGVTPALLIRNAVSR